MEFDTTFALIAIQTVSVLSVVMTAGIYAAVLTYFTAAIIIGWTLKVPGLIFHNQKWRVESPIIPIPTTRLNSKLDSTLKSKYY